MDGYEQLIERAGGCRSLARALKISAAAVSLWRHNGIPIGRLRDLEARYGISRAELRPDIYD